MLLLLVTLSCSAVCAGGRRAGKCKAVVAEQATKETHSSQFLYAFYAARNSLALGEYDKGMALLLYCKQLEPQDAATLQSLGYLWQGLQQTETALDYYRRAWELEPGAYWANYSAMLYNLENYATAATVLEKAAELNPKDTEPLEALQTIYVQTDELKKALQVQDKIEALEGITAYNTMERYRLHVLSGQPKKAVQAVERYLQDNPDDLRYRVFMGDVYLQSGKTEEALAIYFNELEQNPQNPYALFSLGDYCIQNEDYERAADYVTRGILSEELSWSEKIQNLTKRYQKLLSAMQKEEEILLQLVEDFPLEDTPYRLLTEYYERTGNHKASKGVMQSRLELQPEKEELWEQALDIYLADTTSTNEDISKIIRGGYALDTTSMHWRYWMCRMLQVEQQYDSMIHIGEASMELTGDLRYKLGICILLGDMYMFWEDTDNTFRMYEAALQIDPQNIYVLNNYAYSLATHGGDLKKAERMSQKTIEQEPNNATYLDTYAWIMYLQGQNVLAKFYIEKAKYNMSEQESEEIEEHYKVIVGNGE